MWTHQTRAFHANGSITERCAFGGTGDDSNVAGHGSILTGCAAIFASLGFQASTRQLIPLDRSFLKYPDRKAEFHLSGLALKHPAMFAWRFRV